MPSWFVLLLYTSNIWTGSTARLRVRQLTSWPVDGIGHHVMALHCTWFINAPVDLTVDMSRSYCLVTWLFTLTSGHGHRHLDMDIDIWSSGTLLVNWCINWSSVASWPILQTINSSVDQSPTQECRKNSQCWNRLTSRRIWHYLLHTHSVSLPSMEQCRAPDTPEYNYRTQLQLQCSFFLIDVVMLLLDHGET